jgi:phage shock protein A
MFTVPGKSYFLGQAATLLRFAKQTGDPKLAAGLLDKAAELNDKVEDVSLQNMDVRAQAPDVERQT